MNSLRIYIVVLTFFLGLQHSIAQQYVLSRPFSFRFNHEHVESALDTIAKVTGYSFSYNPYILDNLRPINAEFHEQPLSRILNEIFKGQELNFKEVCSYITITRKSAGSISPDMFTSYTDSSEYYYLRATVTDRSEHKPVPYANVILKGRNIGTITNQNGLFSLKIPSGCINDSLVVSSIGYKSVSRNITTILPGEEIMIEPVSVQLNEIVVNYFDPVTLIKMALDKVSSNYSAEPELQIGFYRETSKQNNDYIVISEAVLKILKAAYDHDFKTDQVVVYKNRKSPFVKSMDTITYKLQGGIYNSLMIDMAKNPASFISDDYFNMYQYRFEGVVQYNDGLVYVISFDQKPEVMYPLYKGKIYIDKKTLAFVKAEFGISPLGLDYATSILVRKSSSKIKAKVLGANYLVSYVNLDDRWKLHHVREEIKIRVRKKFSFFNSTFQSVSELVITDSDTASISRFRNADIVKANHVLAEVSNAYDESFWGKFNFIQPEETLEEAYSKIKTALSQNTKNK
jgi:hypothetical protein